MNFLKVTVNAGLNFDQVALTQALKQDGGDCIQLSDGLFVATSQTKEALQIRLKDLDLGSFQLELIPADSPSLNLDMQNLIKKYESAQD